MNPAPLSGHLDNGGDLVMFHVSKVDICILQKLLIMIKQLDERSERLNGRLDKVSRHLEKVKDAVKGMKRRACLIAFLKLFCYYLES